MFDAILKKSAAKIYSKFDTIKKQLGLIREYNQNNSKQSFTHPKMVSLVNDEPLSNLDILNVIEHKKENFLPCKWFL